MTMSVLMPQSAAGFSDTKPFLANPSSNYICRLCFLAVHSLQPDYKAKTLWGPHFTTCQRIAEIFIQLCKEYDVRLLSVTRTNTEIRGRVIVRFPLLRNHVLVSD